VEWRSNDRAVIEGRGAIASMFRFGRALDIWVVTEGTRERTRILLDDEY
jgi:hypothetical protein